MDDLRLQAGEDVFCEGKGIDVDRVLLRSLQAEPDFVALEPNILGCTQFYPDGRFQIQISSSLADNAVSDLISRRRLRTTLAHECGHVVCHRPLFMADTSTLSLFDHPANMNENQAKIICRTSNIGNFHYKGEWWEYQANRCMASLLLPRELFLKYAKKQISIGKFPTFEAAIETGNAMTIVRQLSEIFDVSQQAVFFRLSSMGFVPKEEQKTLSLYST